VNRAPDGDPATIRLWSLSEEALVEEGAEPGSLLVVSRWGEVGVAGVGALTLNFLRRMALGPVSLANATVPANGDRAAAGADDLGRLDRVLDELSGIVVHSLGLPDGRPPLMSANPIVAAPAFRMRAVPPGGQVRLSRFASMWRHDEGLTLDMPGAHFRVVMAHPIAWRVAAALGRPSTVAGLAEACEVPAPVVADVVSFLVAAGVVLLGDRDGRFGDDDPEPRDWSPHELLFHARSRSRWREQVADADVRRAREDPSPLTRPVPDGERFPLHRPSIEALEAKDPTLTRLLEDDHCCPHFTDADISADQVGELLFRSARIRSVGPTYLPVNITQETSQRPYFSIACLYELEIYLSLNRCAGLPRAIFHYDPAAHSLTLINDDQVAVDAVLDTAKIAAGNRTRPAAVITVTARTGRLSWLFDGAAYATTLMHLGTLQQTLYLSAKAMGLSAHAVTVDASDTVDTALGLEWPAEVTVGECVIDSHETSRR